MKKAEGKGIIGKFRTMDGDSSHNGEESMMEFRHGSIAVLYDLKVVGNLCRRTGEKARDWGLTEKMQRLGGVGKQLERKANFFRVSKMQREKRDMKGILGFPDDV